MQKHMVLLEAVRKDVSLLDSELDVYRGKVLLGTLLKKYIPDSHHASVLHDEALKDFLERNEAMASRHSQISRPTWGVLERARLRLENLFLDGPFQTNILTLDACLNRGRSGPGSSNGVRDTDFVGKMFCSDLTVTNLCLYKHYASQLSDRWSAAEETRLQRHTVVVVSGSKITSVPKDVTKNRTIASEPSLNMFYQLGAKEVLEDLLRRVYKLDVAKQPGLNKILACSGSLDGSNATIDLKNASDSWSVDLVKFLLPRETFGVLDVLRSRHAQVEGSTVKLGMFSTMGNGFTFPLMTLLFTVILDEFLRERGDAYTPYRDGVFGDDIILPAVHSSAFIHLLEEIGFIVNTDKSFTSGHFRESCGGDYYHGFDVRGIYIRRFTTDEDYYSTFNRLVSWSVRSGILLTNALLYLKGLVDFRPVPLDEADYAGIKCPSVFLRSAKTDGNGCTIYRCSVPIVRRRLVRDDHENPHGALCGALGGFVRDNLISMRENAPVSYKVIKCKTPSWDFIPDARVSHGGMVFLFRLLLNS